MLSYLWVIAKRVKKYWQNYVMNCLCTRLNPREEKEKMVFGLFRNTQTSKWGNHFATNVTNTFHLQRIINYFLFYFNIHYFHSCIIPLQFLYQSPKVFYFYIWRKKYCITYKNFWNLISSYCVSFPLHPVCIIY